MGDKSFGLDSNVIAQYAQDIKQIIELGVQVAIVIGGGNIYRGMNEAETGIERAQGDYMGMLATVINGMALQAGLEKVGVFTRLQSAIKMEQIAEPYIRRRAIRHLEKGRVVIFGAGSLGLTALDLFQRNNVVVYGLLDDDKNLHGKEFGEVSVLGETDDDGFLKLIGQKCEAFVAIADGRVRRRLVKMLNERRKVQPVNAIHDTAVVSILASLGHGNLVAARTVVNPYASVGQHCIIQSGVVIESQATLGDYVNIGTGSIINSSVSVEEGAFIGSGVTIISGVTIGKNARVGAGSVVVENVDTGATVFGNPAKKL